MFLGQIIDRDGIRADPEKTSAIRQMEAPKNVSELRRFLGMVNQLGKFSPHIAELSQPLRELLSTKHSWIWGSSQEQAFFLSLLYWHSMIHKLQPRYQLMRHHTDWELFFSNKLKTSGSLLPTHPDRCPILRSDMHRLKRRCLQ